MKALLDLFPDVNLEEGKFDFIYSISPIFLAITSVSFLKCI